MVVSIMEVADIHSLCGRGKQGENAMASNRRTEVSLQISLKSNKHSSLREKIRTVKKSGR